MTAPIDARSLKWLEYVNESVMGTFPTNPTMLALPGHLTDWEFGSGPEFESYNAFKGAADADPLSSGQVTKTSETHEWNFTVKATGLGLLPHAILASTISAYTPGITHLPFSLGAKIGTQYTTWVGCVVEEWMLSIPDKKSAAEISVSGKAMNRADFSATDYKGTGAHAAAPSGAALTMNSLTSVTYDSASFDTANLAMESLKFGFKNSVDEVVDLGSSFASKIGNWSFGPREIALEMSATLLDVTVIDDIKDGGEHEVEFTLGGKTFTFTDVVWTDTSKIKCDPENLIALPLTAEPQALRVAIA